MGCLKFIFYQKYFLWWNGRRAFLFSCDEFFHWVIPHFATPLPFTPTTLNTGKFPRQHLWCSYLLKIIFKTATFQSAPGGVNTLNFTGTKWTVCILLCLQIFVRIDKQDVYMTQCLNIRKEMKRSFLWFSCSPLSIKICEFQLIVKLDNQFNQNQFNETEI